MRIEAGAEQTVRFTLKARDLAYWDAVRHAWRVEKDRVRVLAGGASDSLPVEAEFAVENTAEFKP